MSDPGAPFGRKDDGTPKKGPGGRPSGKVRAAVKRATRTRSTSGATSRPATPSRSRKPNTPRAKPVDYRKAATEVVQLAAGVVGMVPAPAFKLDALLLHVRAEEIAECVHDAAQDLPWLSGMLDRFTAATPWAKPAMLGASLLMQVAVNHGMIPIGQARAFGAVSPEELAAVAGDMMPPVSDPTPAPAPQPPEDPAPAEETEPYVSMHAAANSVPYVPLHTVM